jgi:hypothetical protein
MSDRFDLTGRVSLVTGATKGLGRAMVQGLAEAGSDVVVVSRKADLCEQVAKEIEESTGRRALPYACNVGEWDALPNLKVITGGAEYRRPAVQRVLEVE